MSQAIRTRLLQCTNTKPVRVVAECQALRKTYSVTNMQDYHAEAARKLAEELGWQYGELVGGGLRDGSMVWVWTDNKSPRA